jgi:hypothetical protein
MADLIYLAVMVGFFALAALFVVACDHIVGPDELAADLSAERADDTSGAVAEPPKVLS